MAKSLISVTVDSATRTQLNERAAAQHMSQERYAGEILRRALSRPDWSEVSREMDLLTQLAQVDLVVEQADRILEQINNLRLSLMRIGNSDE